jgi:hypothetical protein
MYDPEDVPSKRRCQHTHCAIPEDLHFRNTNTHTPRKFRHQISFLQIRSSEIESSWNVMTHGDAREEKWRTDKRMEWVASKRHVTAEHRLARAVQTLQADVYSSPASSRLNWRPCLFKWTRPFRWKTKSGFCACAITFQKQSTTRLYCTCDVPLSDKHDVPSPLYIDLPTYKRPVPLNVDTFFARSNMLQLNPSFACFQGVARDYVCSN